MNVPPELRALGVPVGLTQPPNIKLEPPSESAYINAEPVLEPHWALTVLKILVRDETELGIDAMLVMVPVPVVAEPTVIHTCGFRRPV